MLSLPVFAHRFPQTISPAGQEVTHCEFEQVVPCGQTVPQLPQL
jgi:hypothetical protein